MIKDMVNSSQPTRQSSDDMLMSPSLLLNTLEFDLEIFDTLYYDIH